MAITNSFLKLLSTGSTKINYVKLLRKKYASSCNGNNISTVGFIGLGAMGRHMAKHIIKQFSKVIVYDIDESASSMLAKEGASVARQVDNLSDSDCIISMIATNQQVLEVYQPPNGLISKVRPGTLIVDCSTVSPEVPQKLAAEALQNNITFVDAPVSGGVMAAASGQLTFMVGGSEEGARLSEPVLRCMGKNVVHCGPPGSGQVAKICNNLLLGISMIATAEAMNMGMRLGLDPKLLANVINSSSGRCWSSDTYNPVPGVLDNVPSSNSYQVNSTDTYH